MVVACWYVMLSMLCKHGAAAVNRLVKEKNSKHKSGSLLEYSVNNQDIVHSNDNPHNMIKGVPNNLQTKNIIHYVNYEREATNTISDTASWDDVFEMFSYDRSGGIRLLPKITDEHINPMKRKMINAKKSINANCENDRRC